MSSLIGKFLAKSNGAPPVPYAGRGYLRQSMMEGGADPTSYMRAYGSSGTVFSIVSMLARQTAKKSWHLYRQQPQDGRRRYTTGDKGSDQRVEVIKHQAIALWNRPNDFMTGFQFRELGQTYLDTTGEDYIVVGYDSRATFPMSLWQVRPDRMEPVPHREKYLAGYIYTGPSGERVPLETHEVIQIKYPNPFDPYHGLGPIQALLVDIDAAKYSAQWNRNFFLNSATPGGVIQVDRRLNDDEWNEFTNRWREAHRGVGAAHRVAVLEQGAQWVPNSMSMRDMDFGNLRNVSRDVIREAFQIHKAILGTSDDVNRANSVTAQEHFESFLLTDRLDRWRDVLNCSYLPLFGSTGEGVELDYEDPVTGNREADALELQSKATAAKVLVDAGYDPHAVLETVGLPDMDVVEQATQAPALPPGWVAEPAAPAPGEETGGTPSDTAALAAAVARLLGEDIENAQRWIAVAHLDDNTCLAPEARVTTRSGLVPAKDVTLEDELLTHSGRWVTPSQIVVSEVEEQLTRVHLADGRSLRLTWDHPVLVSVSDGFAWRHAADLSVGDLVVDQSSLELGEELGGIDLGLGEAPDRIATARDVVGLPAVDVRPEAVPVRPVRLDDEPVANHEVDDPRAYLNLGAVGKPQVFEGLADAALDAGLGVTGAVAADRAVPLAGHGRGNNSELVPAVLAGDDDGRPSAGLGAVPAILGLGVSDGGSTAGAIGVAATGVVAAHTGAVVVPVSGAHGNVKLDATSSACFGDAAPAGSTPLLPVLGVGVHALARAVDGALPVPPRDRFRADLAQDRRPVRVLTQEGCAAGTAEAERASLDGLAAVRTRLVHGQSVQVTTVKIRAVEKEPHVGEVYDFTIPGDHTFWAEGVLVHNCDPCRENDGKTYKNRQQAYEDYPNGQGFKDCVGAQYGNACRCKVVKRRKGDDGRGGDEQRDSLEELMAQQLPTWNRAGAR